MAVTGGRPPFGEDDSVDSGSVGGSEEGPEIVRVFESVESEEKAVLTLVIGGQKVFDAQELPLPDDGQDTLMGVRCGPAG